MNHFTLNRHLYMQSLLVVLLFLTGVATVAAQQAKSTNDPAFPANFIGRWKGKLQWMMPGKPAQEFSMQLIVQPTDSSGQYTWQIIYGDQGKDNRPYLLRQGDTSKAQWVIDEGDGILLSSYVLGNAIHGAFTVQQSTIVDSYRVEGDTMFVEFFNIKLADKQTSGKGTEETPFVDSYRVGSYQQGVLERQH